MNNQKNPENQANQDADNVGVSVKNIWRKIVEKWEIMRPITRERTLNFISPKSYLTVIDYIRISEFTSQFSR